MDCKRLLRKKQHLSTMLDMTSIAIRYFRPFENLFASISKRTNTRFAIFEDPNMKMTSLYKDAAMETLITRTIRAAMAQDGMSYADLSASLQDNGISQSESTLRSKVNNGTMAASLFLHILSCTSITALEIASFMEKYQRIKREMR